MAGVDLNDFISRVPVFSNLTADERAVLIKKLTEKSILPGGELFREGDKGDSLYIIKTGEVKISKQIGKGVEKILSTLGPMNIIGEMALLEEGTRSASATAVNEAAVLELTKHDLEDMVREHSSAGYSIMAGIARVLSSRLRKMNEELASVFSHPFRSIKELEVILDKVRNNFIPIGWGKE